jgi:hypothetical protein
MTRRLRYGSPLGMASLIAVALVAALAAGCGSSSGSSSSTTAAATSASDLAPIHGRYSPSIDPANFVATVDNRYFPLKAGHRLPLRGHPWNDPADGRHGRDPSNEDDPRDQVHGRPR